MTLVDTSVWVDHLRSGNAKLSEMLEQQVVLTHPFVIGELACGSLRYRDRVLRELHAIPAATPAHHDDVLHLIEERRLWGKGIGWVDCHLLASSLLSNCHLWTFDGSLSRVASGLGILN